MQTIKKNWGESDVPDQSGKTILITGANNGLGFEASRILSKRGARVVMACRNIGRAAAAADAIRKDNHEARLNPVTLDLADLDSVRALPGQLAKQGINQIDTLLNNAGIMMPPRREETRQGFEIQFGVNHLGHFALTHAVFPLLAGDGRIVNVASIADRRGDIHWDDLNWQSSYSPSAAYGQSKTANLLFTLELTRRLAEAKSGIHAVAAHPGVAMTNLATASTLGRWLWLIKPLVAMGMGPKVQAPAMGVLPEVYAAVGEIERGAYYGPEFKIHGTPVRAESHRAAHSSNPKSAGRLWETSEKLTGVEFQIV